jgi:hypothetical protein
MGAKRWLDSSNLVLGLYLLLVPLFTLDSADGSTIWVAEAAGAAVVLIAVWALTRPVSAAAEWTQAAVGVLLFAAPFVFGYTELTGAAWNAYLVGAAVTVFALTAVPAATRLGRTGTGGSSQGIPAREQI